MIDKLYELAGLERFLWSDYMFSFLFLIFSTALYFLYGHNYLTSKAERKKKEAKYKVLNYC